MRKYIKDKNIIREAIGKKPPIVTLCIVGFCIGVMFMNLYQQSLLIDTGLLDEYTLYHLKYLTLDSDVFFFYILKERFSILFWICLLSTTYLGIAVVWFYSLSIGVSFGMLVSACIIRYGIKGISFVFVGLFPQMIVLIPIYIFILFWAYEVCLSIYFKDLYTGSFLLKTKQTRWKQFMYILIVFFAMFFSCILESYVNPKILLEFLKFF